VVHILIRCEKHAFLYGDLQEEVYMEQPPGMLLRGECHVQAQECNLWSQAEPTSLVW